MRPLQVKRCGASAADAPETITSEHACFDLLATPATRTIRIRLRGVWDHEIFDLYELEYFRVVHEALLRGEVDYSLVDASDFGVQPADIAERFTAVIRRTRRSAKRRTAVVVSAIVNKVQAREAGDLLNARYFKTVDAAIDWLFSGEA